VGKICLGHMIRHMHSGCKRTVNGILWEMSELITQEWIAVGSSNLVEGLTIQHDPPYRSTDKVKRSQVKVTRSHNVSAAIML